VKVVKVTLGGSSRRCVAVVFVAFEAISHWDDHTYNHTTYRIGVGLAYVPCGHTRYRYRVYRARAEQGGGSARRERLRTTYA